MGKMIRLAICDREIISGIFLHGNQVEVIYIDVTKEELPSMIEILLRNGMFFEVFTPMEEKDEI